MLFVAISGLLIAVILANSTVFINQQQYRDSILSVQDFLQTQYSKTININNSISNSFSCSFNGSTLTISTGSGSNSKGQSDCLLLGRYITTGISTDGTRLDAYPVVGYKYQSSSRLDLDALKNDYYINFDNSNAINTSEPFNLTWGTYMQQKNGTKLIFSLLIIHSPNSASIYTLASIGSTKTISELLNDSSATSNDLIICINKPSVATRLMGVKVLSNSSNPTGVVYLGDADTSGACI